MDAANSEVEYISERWKALGSEDRSASLMLEDLLNAQSRLADSEFGYLTSSVTYNLAQMNYKKAVGTLLQQEFISVCRNCKCCLPGQTAQKSGAFCNACNSGAASQTMPATPSVYQSRPAFTQLPIEMGLSNPPTINTPVP